jgi:hypothetical protein
MALARPSKRWVPVQAEEPNPLRGEEEASQREIGRIAKE